MLKYLFFILLTISLNANKIPNPNNLLVTPKLAVNYATDSYLTPSAFKKKYKNSDNKVGSTVYNGVRLYAIEESKYVVLIFRGTASIYNATVDINIGSTPFMGLKGTKVHQGFYDIAIHSKDIFREPLQKNKPMFIIGHSLGGAVSVLLGGVSQHSGYDNVVVYSFGSPAVGNIEFVKSIKGLKHYRYVHKQDVVVKLDKQFAKTLHTSMQKLNNMVSSSNNKDMKNIIYSLNTLIQSIDYDYVHDEYKTIMIDGKIIPSKKIKKLPFLVQFAFLPFESHEIETYKNSLDKIY